MFKEFAQQIMADMPVVPFRAAPGIRMVRIDRRSGRRVFGGWPTSDPKSPIIWEAFKPENEPRRLSRDDAMAIIDQQSKSRAPTGDSDFLQRQGGIY